MQYIHAHDRSVILPSARDPNLETVLCHGQDGTTSKSCTALGTRQSAPDVTTSARDGQSIRRTCVWLEGLRTRSVASLCVLKLVERSRPMGGADEESCCGASPMFTSGTAGGCDVGTAPGAPPVPWTAFSADSIAALLAACTTWRTCVYVCAPCTRPINARVSLLLAHCILFDRVSAGAETYFRVVDPTYRTKSAKWPIGNVMRSKPCTMLYASMPGRPRREKARAPDSGFSGGHRRQHRRCALARRAARTRFSNAVPGAQHRPPARSEAAVARSRRAVASIATCAHVRSRTQPLTARRGGARGKNARPTKSLLRFIVWEGAARRSQVRIARLRRPKKRGRVCEGEGHGMTGTTWASAG